MSHSRFYLEYPYNFWRTFFSVYVLSFPCSPRHCFSSHSKSRISKWSRTIMKCIDVQYQSQVSSATWSVTDSSIGSLDTFRLHAIVRMVHALGERLFHLPHGRHLRSCWLRPATDKDTYRKPSSVRHISHKPPLLSLSLKQANGLA